MNTYAKYMPNVWLAKCDEKHEKGETIEVTTRRGKENECIVFNLIAEKDGYFYYSIVRADGFNAQEWAKKRADMYAVYAQNANKKSTEYYNRSNKDRDFLSLGEPVKVGHHSENRHRKIIDEAWNNMGKSVEFGDKAKGYEEKSAYWEGKADVINLSMPESIDFYRQQLDEAIEYRTGLKNGSIEREHSYSLVYANKRCNELKKKLEMAIALWG